MEALEKEAATSVVAVVAASAEVPSEEAASVAVVLHHVGKFKVESE